MNMGIQEEFVTWLIQEMEKRGWSYSETARRAGISQSTISKIISYTATPGLDFCTGIAKAFNIPIENVLHYAGHITTKQDLNTEQNELVHLFDQLNYQDQENLLIQLRALVREKGQPYIQSSHKS